MVNTACILVGWGFNLYLGTVHYSIYGRVGPYIFWALVDGRPSIFGSANFIKVGETYWYSYIRTRCSLTVHLFMWRTTRQCNANLVVYQDYSTCYVYYMLLASKGGKVFSICHVGVSHVSALIEGEYDNMQS